MGLNIKKTEDFNEWKKDNPQAFVDEGKPQPKPVEGVTREQLWQTINENTILKQENFYLKTKIKQIEVILNEIKNYGN